ncbi:MAG: 50S ribosomal protein L11 methyltransferase [Limisphaerales bacterium]
MWQVSISTTAQAEEAVACLLERHFQQPASTYCDEATGARIVSIYPQRLAPVQTVRARLRDALGRLKDCGLDLGGGRITIKPLPRQNWAESWKRHFKPVEVGPFLLIKPAWSRRRARQGQRVVILDPGLSFGTGHHHTTFFCLQQLARCRRPGQNQSFLDIGTGSGILAIAAAKLGYSSIEAFDNDPAAVRVSRQNAKKNQVQNRVWPRRQDLTTLKSGHLRSPRRYDVICANLACNLLTSEASKICGKLNPGGKLIVAGILRREFAEVVKKLRRFNLTLQHSMNDRYWKSGQFV